jgi:hypothetical protein
MDARFRGHDDQGMESKHLSLNLSKDEALTPSWFDRLTMRALS